MSAARTRSRSSVAERNVGEMHVAVGVASERGPVGSVLGSRRSAIPSATTRDAVVVALGAALDDRADDRVDDQR